MTKKEYILLRQVSDLFFLVNSGEATTSQQSKLENLLNESDQAMDIYLDLIVTCAGLTEADGLCGLNKSFDTDISKDPEDIQWGAKVVSDSNVSLRGVEMQDILADGDYDLSGDSEMTQAMLELLEYEKNAPAVEIPKAVENHKEEPPRELIQKVVYKRREKYKFSTFQKFQFAACAAAVLFFVLFVKLVPNPVDLPVVAELVDTMNSVWDDDMQLPDDGGFMRQSTYRLNKGYVSIRFNGGAKITVEAPAEWSLLGGGNMELFRGRIYAVVPEEAHGFTVMAVNSKIVDLGTEFGVEVDDSSAIQLHVTKGETLLFSGLLAGKKSQANVSEGSAKKVYSDGFVKDIDVATEKFVRHIYPKMGRVWKGLNQAEAASSLSYFQITGDADSGISSSKTYTHAIDFGGTADVVNGVAFAGDFNKTADGGSNSGSRTFGTEQSAYAPAAVSGNVAGVLTDFCFGGAEGDYIELTGLTPGKWYRLIMYDRPWKYDSTKGSREYKLTFDVDSDGSAEYATQNWLNQDNPIQFPQALYDLGEISWATGYVYQAGINGSIKITFELNYSDQSYHLYGLTNEEVKPSSADAKLKSE